MYCSIGNYEAFARPRKPEGMENKRINEAFIYPHQYSAESPESS